MYCELQQLDTARWWCPICDPAKRRTTPVKSRRKCKGKATPPSAEDVAMRWQICRSNGCGHYLRKGNLDVCSMKRCNGRTYLTPIQGLVEGLGCPEKHW